MLFKDYQIRITILHATQEADLIDIHTGPRIVKAEVEEPSGDTRPTEAGQGGEQLHTIEQAGISSRHFKHTACNARTALINENISLAENHNLLMMGTGKTKLATVHYVFDSTELESIPDETRPSQGMGLQRDQYIDTQHAVKVAVTRQKSHLNAVTIGDIIAGWTHL